MTYVRTLGDIPHSYSNTINIAVSSFTKANTANYYAYLVDSNTTAAFAKSNTANALAFQANANANSAFAKANTLINYNYAINGSFEICQRGNTFSNTSSTTMTVDRFMPHYDGTIGSYTISRALLPAGDLNNFTYALRWNHTAAGSSQSYKRLMTQLEDIKRFCGKTVTVSFYAKANSGSHACVSSIDEYWGTGGSPSSPSNSSSAAGGNHTITTTWTRFTSVWTVNSGASKTFGTTPHTSFLLWRLDMPVNATIDLYITGLKIEIGSEATPYEIEDQTETLKRCKRYFQKTWELETYPAVNSGITTGAIHTDYAYAAGAGCLAKWDFSVQMRAAPTISTYNPRTTGGDFRDTSNTHDGAVTTHMTSDRGVALIAYSSTQTGYNYTIHATASAEIPYA
jgi:hypothetical protein